MNARLEWKGVAPVLVHRGIRQQCRDMEHAGRLMKPRVMLARMSELPRIIDEVIVETLKQIYDVP